MTNTATLQAIWDMEVPEGHTHAWHNVQRRDTGELWYGVLLVSGNGRRIGTLFQPGKRTSCDFTCLAEAGAWFGDSGIDGKHLVFERHTELEKQLADAAKWAEEQTKQAEKEQRERALQQRLDIATQNVPYTMRKRVH